MSSDHALVVRGLSKSYTIRHEERHVTLAERTLARIRRPLARPSTETFWALNDLSFSIPAGEVVGVVGRNGAGKSTLLKVLSRITPPTRGEVEVYGRIGSLLEVGTGFHPELSGRENVYLNGSILGMRRVEIDRRFDEIVEFAGVQRFLDTPVKRYSSGMYVRLAFAVAAHLDSEILLVDEVLAVGDLEFQEKCLGRMQQVAGDGRTVLLVSHNLDTIQRLCNRAVVLAGGSAAFVGDVHSGVAAYLESLRSTASEGLEHAHRIGSGEYRIVAASMTTEPVVPAGTKIISIDIERRHGSLDRFFLGANIYDAQRRPVAHCDSRLNGLWSSSGSDRQTFELELRTPWLKPGRHEVDLFVCNAGVIDGVTAAITFHVAPVMPYPAGADEEATAGAPILCDFEWRPGTPASSALRALPEDEALTERLA